MWAVWLDDFRVFLEFLSTSGWMLIKEVTDEPQISGQYFICSP